MDIKEVIGFGFVMLSTLSTQFPQLFFRHHPKMTGAELAEIYPALLWIPYVYPVASVLWFLIFGGIPIFYLISSPVEQFSPFLSILNFLGGALGSTSILNGVLGLVTNVCPIPNKRNRLYVYAENMQPIALIILAVGVLMIMIALAMIYFYVL